MRSPNRHDAAMDWIIGQGLQERGYDALVLEGGRDQHIFKLSGDPARKAVVQNMKGQIHYETVNGHRTRVLGGVPHKEWNQWAQQVHGHLTQKRSAMGKAFWMTFPNITKAEPTRPTRGKALLVQRRIPYHRRGKLFYRMQWMSAHNPQPGEKPVEKEGYWLRSRGHDMFLADEHPEYISAVKDLEASGQLIGAKRQTAEHRAFLMNIGQMERQPARTKEAKLAADKAKLKRVDRMHRNLEQITATVNRDLTLSDAQRGRVLAVAMELMLRAHLRVGNEDSSLYGHEGTTTLTPKHIQVNGDRVSLHFLGKSGVHWDKEIEDAPLAEALQHLLGLAKGDNQPVLRYRGQDGSLQPLKDSEVRSELKARWGILPKDFRTWAATVKAYEELKKISARAGETLKKSEVNKRLREAIERVAVSLGHTPAMCKNSYIAPALLDEFKESGGRMRLRAPAFRV